MQYNLREKIHKGITVAREDISVRNILLLKFSIQY